MSARILALIIALFSGVAMAVQGGMNSALGKITGLLEATLIVHGTATAVILTTMILLRTGNSNLNRVAQAPWYLLLGGFIGVLITYGVVASIPRVGVSLATTAIIVGQVSAAMLIDHLGMFGLQKIPVTWMQFLGLLLLVAGGRLMLR